MKNRIFLLCLLMLCIPMCVHAKGIESFTDDDFFDVTHVGWNLGNQLDVNITWDGNVNMHTETHWGQPTIKEELIDYVQSKGFNIIRIPVSWYCHTYKDANGNYIIYDDWMDRVQQVVDYAYSRGMYVILNTHHDDDVLYVGTTDEKFEKVKSVAASLWKQIANRFKDYDEHLLFEAYNEIDNRETSWEYGDLAASQVNELNQIFVGTVRNTGSNNRYRLLIISPVIMKNTNQAISAVEVPTDSVQNKIMLSVHFYPGSEDELLAEALDRMATAAEEKGLRLIITEFGNTDSYQPAEHRGIALSNYVARAYERGIRVVYWDNGSNYAIFDRTNLNYSNQKLIDALTKPYKYTNPNGHLVINQLDQFYYKRLTSKGAFDEKNLPQWWGTWINEEMIEIPEGVKFISMGLYNTTMTPLLNNHGLFFYDEDGTFISSSTTNYPGYDYTKFTIPEGAKYFRYQLYNSKVNTKLPYFTEIVENGQFYLSYGMYGLNELVGERVYFKEIPVEPTENNEVNPEENLKNANVEKKVKENPATGVYDYLFLIIPIFVIGSYVLYKLKIRRKFKEDI